MFCFVKCSVSSASAVVLFVVILSAPMKPYFTSFYEIFTSFVVLFGCKIIRKSVHAFVQLEDSTKRKE